MVLEPSSSQKSKSKEENPMITLSTEWEGLDNLITDLEKAPGALSKVLQEAQKEDFRDIASLLANYPPPKPGSLYDRTGTLGVGWLTAQPVIETGFGTGFDFKASISNDVEYAGFVQGGKEDNPHQTKEFVGRWKTTDQVIAETESRAESRAEKKLQEALNDLDRK
jgi:hypothetical protein